ncbi:MAG: GNAT family N-acetyltransferase [Candidatus Eisenbacteria bacterium]|nr:GNAT family N-acetyltransferase [Candidatus Eisenbacteria bacterium]
MRSTTDRQAAPRVLPNPQAGAFRPSLAHLRPVHRPRIVRSAESTSRAWSVLREGSKTGGWMRAIPSKEAIPQGRPIAGGTEMQRSERIRAPRLRTARLRLEQLRPSDAALMWEAVQESRRSLARWMPWVAGSVSSDDMAAFVRRTRRSPRDLAWGIWPAGRAGAYGGTVGLHAIYPSQGTAMIGYWVRQRFAGCGHASEAAAAVILWAFAELGLERLEVSAATGNAASLRVIEKLGFVREGRLRHAQRIPGRRRRLDWFVASLIRSDLRRQRRGLRALTGAARPWES